MRRIAPLFNALCLLLALGAFAVAGDSAPVIAILHTNDVHGRFAASDTAIGHDRIAAVYVETRSRIPATVLLDAGDAIQGTGLVKWNKGEAALEIMNAAGYDALVLGNHEFDYGWDNLVATVGTAEFPVLTQPVVSEDAPGFEAAVLFERGGRRIGVFGLTTPETKQSSGGGMGKTFGDTDEIIAYANAMTASLRRAGAEVVVCLTHLGIDDQGFITSYGLRDAVDGIDVIVDGHSHTPLADIVQAEGKALIVSTGEHAQALGIVEFRCERGRLAATARSIMKDQTVDIAPDPAVGAVIAKWTAESEARGAKVLTRNPVALDGARSIVRTRESELGNLMADAVRAATGCDAALLNGGNFRASLPAGDVTIADVEAVLPYDTTVLTADLPGGVLREALELSVSRYPSEFGGFLHVSGLAFTFDPALRAGKRITAVTVGGAPLDDDRLYKVSTCDWIASGGDGYEMLTEAFEKPSENDAVPLIDIFVQYLDQLGDEPPTLEERIVPARQSL